MAISKNIDNTNNFVDMAWEIWAAQVNWLSAMTYDATQAYIAALSQNHPDPTRKKIKDTLLGNFCTDGAFEEVCFESNGDRKIPVKLGTIKKTETGYKFVNR